RSDALPLASSTRGQRGRALLLVELDRARRLCARFRDPAGLRQHGRKSQPRIRVVDEGVRRLRQLDGFARETQSVVGRSLAHQSLRSRRTPGDRCLELVPPEPLALARQLLRLLGGALRETRAREQRRRQRSVYVEAELTQAVVGATKISLSRR